MEKKERLQEVFNYLHACKLIKTQVDLAEKTKSSKTTISCAMAGNEKYLTDNLLRRINQAFGGIFNDEWLIKGVGDMLAPHTTINQTFNRAKNINSGTAQQVGDNNCPILEEVVKQQSEQIGKLIDDNTRRGEQIDKLISMLADKM